MFLIISAQYSDVVFVSYCYMLQILYNEATRTTILFKFQKTFLLTPCLLWNLNTLFCQRWNIDLYKNSHTPLVAKCPDSFTSLPREAEWWCPAATLPLQPAVSCKDLVNFRREVKLTGRWWRHLEMGPKTCVHACSGDRRGRWHNNHHLNQVA